MSDDLLLIYEFKALMAGMSALSEMLRTDTFILLNRLKKGMTQEEQEVLWKAADLFETFLNMTEGERLAKYGVKE